MFLGWPNPIFLLFFLYFALGPKKCSLPGRRGCNTCPVFTCFVARPDEENPPPKKSIPPKNSSERVFLSNFCWVPDSCHRKAGRSSRKLFKNVCANTVFLVYFWICGGLRGLLFSWKFKHLEGEGQSAEHGRFEEKTGDCHRKPQEAADWRPSPLGSFPISVALAAADSYTKLSAGSGTR